MHLLKKRKEGEDEDTTPHIMNMRPDTVGDLGIAHLFTAGTAESDEALGAYARKHAEDQRQCGLLEGI